MISQKIFILRGGYKCPFCNSDHLLPTTNLKLQDKAGSIKVECTDCGKVWYENYGLTGFTEVTDT